VDQVENALRADGRQVQVLNGGTAGWSTDQELLWLRHQGLALEPDIVVLCFYQNDVYWNGQRAYGSSGKPRFPAGAPATTPEPFTPGDPGAIGWFARHTALGGLAHRLFDRSGADTWMPFRDLPLAKDEAVVLRAPPPELRLEDCWARTEACLQGLKATCAEQNLPLLVVTLPDREEVQPHSAELWLDAHGVGAEEVDFAAPVQRFSDLARALEIPVVDPTAALQEEAAEQDVYYAHDWHLNPAGNRVVARALYAALTEPAFLGGPAHATPALAAPPTPGLPRWVLVLAGLWVLLSILYAKSYADESLLPSFAKVAGLILAVVAIFAAVSALAGLAGPRYGPWIGLTALTVILGFLLVKSWSHLGIIREVYWSFVAGGRWYMLPLLVAMLTIGNLLIVASSSPFVAPFIYTLF